MRRQVTGILPMPITPGVTSPTNIPSVAIIPDMPVIIATQAQEALHTMIYFDPEVLQICFQSHTAIEHLYNLMS